MSLFLPCAGGVEALLADEVRALLPAARVRAMRGGVGIDGGTLHDAMRLNLHSRLAQRVLVRLAHAPYRDEHALYDITRGVAWRDWLTPQQTLRVDATATRSNLPSLNFAALRVKDAVVDALREATGERPSVNTRSPDLALVLHLDATHATLYADSSGEPLFKRGWRDAAAGKGEAPLKETLAAAMLAAAGWRGHADDPPLLDPCCGAGTIAIEAAQLACRIAPGSARGFAFERLAPWRDAIAAWREMRREARDAVRPAAVAIHAGDVSFRMTDFATRNAVRAGVGAAIALKTADALQREAPAGEGVLLMNPPYGERIAPKGRGSARDGTGVNSASRETAADGQAAFFAQLAAHWKRHYSGWTAWVLSPDAQLPAALRLKATRRVPLWNGPIECRLFRFELVAGSNRS